MNSFWRYEKIANKGFTEENYILINILNNLRIIQKIIYIFTLGFSHNPSVHYKK